MPTFVRHRAHDTPLIVSGILMFVLVGFITYPIIYVAGIVIHIVGAVKAMNGEWWTPPLVPAFVK